MAEEDDDDELGVADCECSASSRLMTSSDVVDAESAASNFSGTIGTNGADEEDDDTKAAATTEEDDDAGNDKADLADEESW